MTEKKNPQNETVDWAERLKASMSATPTESESPAPSVDDDLAALLRAQLVHREQAADKFEFDLDTSEFEEETEEEEIPAPEDPTDLLWDEDEEEDTDLPWDEDEDENMPAALPAAETVTVYRAEDDDEIVESDDAADAAADLPWDEEEDEEEDTDLPWDEDEDEDMPAALPAAETVTIYRAEDDDEIVESDDAADAADAADDAADLPWEEDEDEDDPPISAMMEPEADSAAAFAYTPARGYCIEPVPYDEEELLSSDDVVADPRLLAAEEESNRLLEETYTSESPDLSDNEGEDSVASPVSNTAESVKSPAKPVRSEPTHRTIPNDPLQLGLDDILPHVDTLPPAEAATRDVPPPSPRQASPSESKTSAYTGRMARRPRDREETVRDAELYLRLGYEEQLTRTEQQEAVEEARRRARERQASAPHSETPAIKVRREYTGREQTPAIERGYARSRRLALTRLCVALVGALFGILHDILGIIPATFGTLNYPGTVLYPAVSVLLTVLFCLPFLSRLGRGLRSLFDFEPTRYAVSALALIAATAHGLLTLFSRCPYLYGGVALFMLAVAAATEYVATVAEATAFSVVSAGKTSFVLTSETTPASAVRAEAAPAERVLTAVRTGRVSDFFARTGKYNPYMGRLNYLLPVALLASIACAGMAIMKGGTLLSHGLPVFIATYLSALPAAYLVSMSLPLLAANRLLCRKGAAVLGAAAPADLCKRGSTRLLIRDGDAVGGLYRKEITLRDDPKADLWRQKAACLFRLMECPLWKESPLGDDLIEGLCVEVAETEEGYVRLFLIDLEGGETNEVMMGTRDALTRRGVRLPKASMESVYKRTEQSRVVYLAFDGAFRIAYAVEYRLGSTFARAAEKLATMGDTAAIVTYDPLVGKELLQVERLEHCPPVEVLRPAYAESVRKTCSASVVATGRSLDLLYPYAACRRMRRVYRLSHLVSWLTLLVAAGLALLSVYLDSDMILSSAAVTAWQILLTVLSVVICLTTVKKKTIFLSPDPKGGKGASSKKPPSDPRDSNL